MATRSLSCLPSQTLAFLRALKRNNRREWFQSRKDQYEAQVRAPMLAIVTRLAGDLRTFAPEIVADPKLFLVAVCALNHVTYEQILERYEIAPAECVRLLSRLDRLKFIELQPANRIRLLVSRTFSWLPDGPIQRFFNEQAHNEFFRSRFNRADEFVLVVNGMLSKGSSAAVLDRLKRIAREFSDYHGDDVKLPLGERSAMSLCVALRHWELEAFAQLRRRRDPARTVKTMR